MGSASTPGSEDGARAGGFEPAPDLSRSIELVERVQGGDPEAWRELFARYRDRLARIIRIRTGARLQRHLDEDDILQEVFLVAVRRVGEFERRSHAGILQWLARIAETVVQGRVEHYQAEKRRAELEVPLARDSATLHGIRVAVDEPSPSQQALRSELEELVDAAVEALEPPEYRAVILHRDYFLEEWEAVQESLARPSVEAAQELYRRAHRKLRQSLQRHLGDA